MSFNRIVNMDHIKRSSMPIIPIKSTNSNYNINMIKKFGSSKEIEIAVKFLAEHTTLKNKESHFHYFCVTKEKVDYNIRVVGPLVDSKYADDKFEDIINEMKITNKACLLDLAPKMYGIVICEQNKSIYVISISDNIKGDNLLHLLKCSKITTKKFNKLLDRVESLHKNGLYHGDLNPENIIYNGKFFFTNFSPKNALYRDYYDFGTMFYYFDYFDGPRIEWLDILYKRLLEKRDQEDGITKMLNESIELYKLSIEDVKKLSFPTISEVAKFYVNPEEF